MTVERYRFLARTTRKQRKKARQGIVLADATITPRTLSRYFESLVSLLPIVEAVKHLSQLDEAVTDWVQLQFEQGSTLAFVSDGLCGLHHFEPFTKRQIPTAWRLYKTWRKLEAPNRAPPLTKPLVYALAHYALLHHDLPLAGILLLAFFALLRTGEVLTVQIDDLLLDTDSGVVRLGSTKTGKRNNAGETVAFEDPFTLDVLHELILLRKRQFGSKAFLWVLSSQGFRYRFDHLLRRFGLQSLNFRPYSLRRGGATHLFQETKSMEVPLLKGRWGSSQVAKIYIMDGLSYVPNMVFTKFTREKLNKFHPFARPFWFSALSTTLSSRMEAWKGTSFKEKVFNRYLYHEIFRVFFRV